MAIRDARAAAGLTQVELARRAGIPRATLSAVENGRTIPSVATALAIAQALGTSVEALFDPSPSIDEWVGPPGERFLAARVGDRRIAYAVEPLLAGPPLFDGRLDLAERSLVIATCDPTVRLLERRLQERGIRLIALARSSRDALDLLAAGRVHAAGVHFSTEGAPDINRSAAVGTEADLALISIAAWDVGVAHARPGAASLAELSRPEVAWVARPEGSGARACLDRLLAGHRPGPALDRVARDHRAVVEIVSSGFAEAGISLRLNADEHRLRFLSVERALYDVAIRRDSLDDPRISALVDTIRSESFKKSLGALPGIDPRRAGEVQDAR